MEFYSKFLKPGFPESFQLKRKMRFCRCYHLDRRRLYSNVVDQLLYRDRIQKSAIVDSVGHKITTYDQLYYRAKRLALYIQATSSVDQITSIGSYLPSSSDYVVSMLATWILGKRFVPLNIAHPAKELEYFIEDSKISVLIHNQDDIHKTNQLKIDLVHSSNLKLLDISSSYELAFKDREFHARLVGELIDDSSRALTEDALVLYTSGTTGRPKGVLHTHTTIQHMIEGLVKSWEYSSDDHILHFLPLHHLHGVLNKLLCVLYAGGAVEFMQTSSAEMIWRRLALKSQKAPTIFMAVPTIYVKLLEHYKKLEEDVKISAVTRLKQMRLHVSGKYLISSTDEINRFSLHE